MAEIFGSKRVCPRMVVGGDAGLAAGLALAGLPTDEYFNATAQAAQGQECPDDCPGLKVTPRQIGGVTLPSIFNKEACGLDAQAAPESRTLQSS